MEAFAFLPSSYLPSLATQAYIILSILSDGEPHPEMELIMALGGSPRSAIQALRGESHGYWFIHNLNDGTNQKAIYQLDDRHLCGDELGDAEARSQRKVKLLKDSREQAQSETERLSTAIEREEEALAEYQQCFEFASTKEKPEPAL